MTERLRINIAWSNLSYSVKNGWKKEPKPILKNVNGEGQCGQLTAIMGPSGAGKTTLINILSGFKVRSVAGSIKINGRERHLESFRSISCCILQDQYLLSYVTVMEAMTVSANLTLRPEEFTKRDKISLITKILEDMRLSESTDTKIGRLSGGEKKRLSIALELIRNPPIMFFDEPTSGLDSVSSIQCMSILKDLASEGRTVICSIHQPSAKLVEKIDNLYVIAAGRCVYNGRVSEVIPFMKLMNLECRPHHNLADFVMEVTSNVFGPFNETMATYSENGKCQKWLNEELSMEFSSLEIIPGYATGTWNQFSVLFMRIFSSHIRDPMLTLVPLFIQVVTAFVIGFTYWDIGNDLKNIHNNSGCLFFSLLFILFTVVMPTLLVFPIEMNLFIKEHFNNWYGVNAYYFARTTADIPFTMFNTTIYVIIIYYMTGQPWDIWRFALSFTVYSLIALVAHGLGLMIGSSVSSLEASIMLGSASGFPTVLFSGFFILVSDMPFALRHFTYISYARYGFEALLLATYGYRREGMECSEDYCRHSSGQQYLEEIGFQNGNVFVSIFVLAAFVVLFRAIAFVLFHCRIYLKQ